MIPEKDARDVQWWHARRELQASVGGAWCLSSEVVWGIARVVDNGLDDEEPATLSCASNNGAFCRDEI